MNKASVKITDLIKKKKGTLSFEITPDITEEELQCDVEPMWYSITWHSKVYKEVNLDIAPIRLATRLAEQGKNILLHVSCDRLKKTFLNELLDFLIEKNICNLFVVLGDNYDETTSEFQKSAELIRYIRKRHGTWFCIGVAGFPDEVDRFNNLKEKAESGADFIITQAFFDIRVFNYFVQRCLEFNAEIPIIPGIFFFEKSSQLQKLSKLCQIHLPDSIIDLLKNKGSNENTGNFLLQNLLLELQRDQSHLHFFTLNKLKSLCKFLGGLSE